MNDLNKFCCQNPDCPDFGKFGLNNLTVCGRFGRKDHIRLLYCRTCKERFSERKGSAFFGLRLTDEKIAQVLNHIAEGCGVRQTARLVGVHRDTVTRIARIAGKQAKGLYLEVANGTIRPDKKIVAANGQKHSGSTGSLAPDLNTKVSAKKTQETINQTFFQEYKQKTAGDPILESQEDEEPESHNNSVLEDIFSG